MNAAKPSPHLGGFTLLKGPVPEGHCAECLTKHAVEQPHNQQSMHWLYQFMEKHGRWPTWHDAMRHCAENVKKVWLRELKLRSVDVGVDPGDPMMPLKPKFKVGDRVGFQYSPKRARSGIIYDVGPENYGVTLRFGRSHLNVAVPHEACWAAGSEVGV